MLNNQKVVFFVVQILEMQILSQTAAEMMSLAIFCRSAPATVDKNPLYEALACRRKIRIYIYKRGNHTASESPASTITLKRLAVAV